MNILQERQQDLLSEEPIQGSLDPFQARLDEKKVQQKNIDPFQQRLDQKTSFANELWDGFIEQVFSPEETPFEQGLGQQIRAIGTQLGGIPGDMIQIAKGAGEYVKGKFPNIGFIERDPTFVQKLGQKALEKVPTSEDLQKKFDFLTSGQYIPESDREQLLQDIGGDTATFLIGANTWPKALRALAIGVASNLASEGMKELNFGEKAQSGAKIGTMLVLSMFNPKGASKYVDGLFDKAYSVLPERAQIGSKNFQNSLSRLEKDLSRGIKTVESKKPVLDAIKEVKKNINDGKVFIKDLTRTKKDLNELRAAKVYDPEFKGTKNVRESLKKNFSKLAKTLDNTILEYGVDNPEFSKWYKEAQLGWGGIEQSKKASKFLSRNIKKYKFQSSLASLAGLATGAFFPGSTVAAGGLGIAGLKSYELMNRFIKNPVLRKYYIETILNATKESAPAMMNSLRKLDKAMLEEDKKKK